MVHVLWSGVAWEVEYYMVHVLWSDVAFRTCGGIPITSFMQVCGCSTMPFSDSVDWFPSFFVSEWKPGCGLVGSSTTSPPVGMFSCHSSFHFSWRLKSFVCLE